MQKKFYNVIKEKAKLCFQEIQNRRMQKNIEDLIKKEDFLRIKNQRPIEIKKIAFVIPDMIPYGGGITSVLRIGTYLEEKKFRVCFVTYGAQKKSEMEKIGRLNYPGCKGRFFEKKDMEILRQCDVIVATSWKSAFYIKKYPAYKMYFIQDFEPYFHQFGELYFLAKKTYEFGFHMITLGEWNRYMIKKESRLSEDEKIDVVDFPYERKEYSFLERDFETYRKKKEIVIAVYIKETPRRLPNLIQVMMKNLADCFAADGRILHVQFYGLNKREKVLTGENIGKLSKKELEQLYHKADFGMVASFSNISLVPYEMIAAGLPVIEFSDGTFPFFFGEDSAILTTGSYIQLYEQMKLCMEHPERLQNMQRQALKNIENVSWKKTCEQFYNIVKSISEK